MMKQRDQVADIDFVKVDYATYAQKNPVKVTTKDLEDYITITVNSLHICIKINLKL